MNAVLTSLPASQGQSICDTLGSVKSALAWGRQHPDRCLTIEDLWAALHFALTAEYPIPRQKAEEMGLTWDETSLENAIMGGAATSQDSSYGPVRYLSPDLVKAMTDLLNDVKPESLRSRVTAEDLMQENMLPNGWDPDDAMGRLPGLFEALRAFYSGATARGDGVLVSFE